MTLTTSRRGFLAGSAATALVIGFAPNGTLAAAGDADAMLTPFVKIGADGSVHAMIKHIEFGQGTATGLSTLIAEEMGLRIDQIGFEFAPSDPSKYANLFFGGVQGTGGSTAMANSFMQYRTAGAAAREMLLSAAAQTWDVPVGDLTLSEGMISGAGKSAPLGEFVATAAQMTPPESPALTDPANFRLIGNESITRLDGAAKANGTAMFAMDLERPNQMIAMIARPEQMGAVATGFDDSSAKEIKGFIRATVMPNGAGVVVFAETTWAAMQARTAIDVTWDTSKAETRDSDQIKAEIMAALDAAPEYNVNKTDRATTEAALENAAQVVEDTFYFPLLAHAPMEPLNCTIEATEDGGILMHDGAQMPTGPHMAMAQIFELPMEKIQIKTMLAGGSFGRRATPTADYQVEAALAFIVTDRSRPVKLVWSREDDLRSGYYRPAFGHKVRVGLDNSGKIVAWDHQIAGQSIMKGTAFAAFTVKDGVDHSSVEGAADSVYQLPGAFFGLTDTKKATSTLWWRAVGHTHTAYVMEVMMDKAAQAAGQDPLDFRLSYLAGGGKDQARKAAVLKLAAEKAGWGQAPAGRAQGLAVHKSFGSYVAEVIEISGTAESGIQIEKITCAVDCGIAVTPSTIRAQIEGGAGYGIGHAMRDQITLTGGVVDQYNFPDYEPLRINDIKEIEVHIVPSAEPPSGVGEPGTPPAAPALANAIAAVSLRWVQTLPMDAQDVSFA